ncbi:MAG: selenocysteine-specific translation elongation factor [Gemmatimonadaceae bacterium]
MILGTAGHIDHGKTTLVRALTGVDTDRLPEERRRGITIELGFAPLVLDGVGTIGVVDVPGHEAFVRTMVAGATGVDLALVVVAADEGVMPQTREHLAILEILGVRAGVVALTKSDLVEPDWLALVEEDVREATSRALPGAAIVATSARTGAGIDELRAALARAARSIAPRSDDDLFRLPIDRVFTIKGTGTVVTGTVWSGSLERDETIRILPGDRSARVRGIQGHGAKLDVAVAGGRAAVALAGVDVADVQRGSTVVSDLSWHATGLARADITLVPGVDAPIRPRVWYRLHIGTSEVGARIVARAADASAPFSARVVFDEPVVCRAGDRFVLRTSAPLNTIAGGIITDPYAPKRAAHWPAGLGLPERLDRLVAESGSAGLEIGTLPVRLGASLKECDRLVGSCAGKTRRLGTKLVDAALVDALGRELVEVVKAYHAEHPLEPGISAQLLRATFRGAPETVEGALAAQAERGAVVNAAGVVTIAGWAPTLTADQAATVERMVAALESAGAEPPSADELSATMGFDLGDLFRYLERRGDLVQVEHGRYYTNGQLERLVDRARQVMTGGKELSPADLRDAFGLSRKYLIPFLEHCDRIGYTARTATGRIWRGA